MEATNRITLNPAIMGGKPCIRGMRVTVGMIVGLLAEGYQKNKFLKCILILRTRILKQPFATQLGALKRLKFRF